MNAVLGFTELLDPYVTDKKQKSYLNAIQITRLTELETSLHERQSFRNIIGKSEAMQKIYTLLEQTADVEFNALVVGESGTGKELVAEAIHHGGRRAGKTLIRVNCAALSDNLLESELFGDEQGNDLQ